MKILDRLRKGIYQDGQKTCFKLKKLNPEW